MFPYFYLQSTCSIPNSLPIGDTGDVDPEKMSHTATHSLHIPTDQHLLDYRLSTRLDIGDEHIGTFIFNGEGNLIPDNDRSENYPEEVASAAIRSPSSEDVAGPSVLNASRESRIFKEVITPEVLSQDCALGDNTLSFTTEDVEDAPDRCEIDSAIQSATGLRIGGKASSRLCAEDDCKSDNSYISSDEDFRQTTRIDLSLVEFDSNGRFLTQKLDTPARLPLPRKQNDQFRFIATQFLIESDMFYRTTGGQIVYDQSKKKFVACFTDKRQEDLLNYDAIRCFMRTLVKNGLNLRGCVLSFYGNIRENSLSVVSYARCKYSSHNQRFKFEMNNVHQTLATISV